MVPNFGPPSIVLEVHGLRFSRERVERTANGRRRFAIARATIRDARIVNDIPRESSQGYALFGALGLVTAIYFAFASSAAVLVRIIGALVALLVTVFVVRFRIRPATLLRLRTERGPAELAFDQRFSDDDARTLMLRLRDELGWPVFVPNAPRPPPRD